MISAPLGAPRLGDVSKQHGPSGGVPIMAAMREALDDFFSRRTLLTIAAAIALGYGLIDLARGASVLVLSIFTEQDGGAGRGPLSVEIGGRILEFAQLLAGAVTLAVVVAVILYVLRRRATDEGRRAGA